jgi:hypothetical protein
MKRSLLTVWLTVLICLFTAFAYAAGRTTRDLVFEDEDSGASKQKDAAASGESTAGGQSIGVKTTMALTRDGKTSTVLPSHEFMSGDKVKLVYTPSVNGYVYWMAKGSSGGHTLIFPSPESGMDNKVERNKEYTIPVKGTFRFDDKPGTEELLCIVSEQIMPDMEKALAEITKAAQASAGKAADGSGKRATRDLVFEDEDEGDVNTQQQTAPKGQPLVAHYVLTHK